MRGEATAGRMPDGPGTAPSRTGPPGVGAGSPGTGGGPAGAGRRPAVFLDRDGVLAEVRTEGDSLRPAWRPDELSLAEGSPEACRSLRRAGFALIVVSNQPDVARGDVTAADVEATNRLLMSFLPIDAVYYCPHDNREGCGCRKPKPGLILTAAREWDVDLPRSVLIGDRWVDVAAAEAAGIDGILLERPYSWRPTSLGGPPAGLRPRSTATTLAGCVRRVLASGTYGWAKEVR